MEERSTSNWLETPAISENELFTDKWHYTINDTSEHGDPIRNTNAGALWAGAARTLVPDDGKFPSEQMTQTDRTGDNSYRPFNVRDRNSLIVDLFEREMGETHVREFNKMRQDEELFTYKRNYITSDTSDHKNLRKNIIAGTLQASPLVTKLTYYNDVNMMECDSTEQEQERYDETLRNLKSVLIMS